MPRIIAFRSHEFAYGHRVYQHESKCSHLHGHNGVVKFYCETDFLDSVGRVIDFSVIKSLLCQWLEDNWDHKFLVNEVDPWAPQLQAIDPTVVVVPFNPTSENCAAYLLNVVGPMVFQGYPGLRLVQVDFHETGKCGVSCEIDAPTHSNLVDTM